uniref:O-methyltransferase n=1 Tax=Panagrolaimus sp. PS1159 TaxID=55785 RepID=A0AC35FAC2_9BILA
MPPIFCRLIFHDFSDKRVENFLRIVQDTQLQYVTDTNFQQPVSLDSDSSERNTEVQFSFQLKGKPGGRRFEKGEKYQRVCIALCELSKLF